MATATSFAVPNYSGMLFRKGNESTPFSTLLGAPLTTNHVEFACGQYFEAETGAQPEISETASLTAPTATSVTRTQLTNVTQIFQQSVSVSYAKEANMGTLSGINVASQTANPQSELDFQVARKMAKIAQDIEYTFINGEYQKATSDAEANKSRGLLTAITTNIVAAKTDTSAAANPMLNYELIVMALKKLFDQGVVINDVILGVNSTQAIQLNYAAKSNAMTAVPMTREINGLNIKVLQTALGNIGVQTIQSLPAGTAVLFNPKAMHPVFQPVPGKGNFFLEPLAKTGAGESYQIFGEAGLDHGPEWMSAKITELSTELPK